MGSPWYVSTLSGLAGVITGALLTGGIQGYFGRSELRNSSRTAARVMFTELEFAYQAVHAHVKGIKLEIVRGAEYLPRVSNAWIDSREAVARASTLSQFQSIASAVQQVDHAAYIWEGDDDGKGVHRIQALRTRQDICNAMIAAIEIGSTRKDKKHASYRAAIATLDDRLETAVSENNDARSEAGLLLTTGESPSPPS